MAFFPFMIQMDDKNCLIAGGGRVALRKVKMMLSFGAFVTVISPTFCEEFLALEGKESKLKIIKRTIQISDLIDRDVVIMATNDPNVNTEFATVCKEQKILVNVVDVKEDCNFYFPAVIRQEDVVISVSTGGNSPLLASHIKKEINDAIRKDYGQIAKEMGKERQKVLMQKEEERREIFEKMMDRKLGSKVIRIGTRGSALARKQTDMVIESLKSTFPDYQWEVVVLTTKGDKRRDVPITSFGGKAVFVEEIEQALADGTIDMAVHSAKDMPNPCKERLTIAGTLPRACIQDVLVTKKGRSFATEETFVAGTGSLRRKWQLEKLFPNVVCKDLRGNVGTRIEKLRQGQYDAVILAAAGLERQGLLQEPDLEYRYFTIDEMLPAAGQAIIAIETKEQTKAYTMAQAVSDKKAFTQLMIERAVLEKLGADCHEPIGVLADMGSEDTLDLRLMTVINEQLIYRQVEGKKTEWEDMIDKICKA